MKQLDSFFRNRLNYPPPRVMGILLGCLLFFASCGGDDSSDDSYAAVESESFTFDETDAANNAVRVMANGAWQVYWEPASAAVTVDPSAGVGNGCWTCPGERPSKSGCAPLRARPPAKPSP